MTEILFSIWTRRARIFKTVLARFHSLNAAVSLFVLVVNFCGSLAIARLLGVEGRGNWSALTTVPLFIGQIALCGVDYAFPLAVRSGRDYRVLIWIGFFGAVGCVAASAMISVLPRFGPSFGLASAVVSVAFVAFRVSQSALLARDRQADWSLSRLPTAVFTTVGTIAGLLLARNQTALTVGYSVSFLLAGITVVLWSAKALRFHDQGVVATPVGNGPGNAYLIDGIRLMYRQGLGLLTSILPNLMLTRADVLALAFAGRRFDLGIYSTALSFGAVLLAVAAGEQELVERRTSRSGSGDMRSTLKAARRTAARRSAMLCLPLSVGIFLIPTVFGRGFTPSVRLAFPLLLVSVVQADWFIFASALRGSGATSFVRRIEWASMATIAPAIFVSAQFGAGLLIGTCLIGYALRTLVADVLLARTRAL